MIRDEKLIDYWRRALAETRQLVFVMDPERRVLAVSPGLSELLGSPAGDLVGQACHAVLHGSGVCPSECPLHDLMRSDTQRQAEIHSDVLDKDLFVTVTPLPGPQGEMELILHVASDITRRRQFEGALREREALLRESQRIAKLGHYVFDIAAGTWTSSCALDEVFGIHEDYPRTLESWLDIVHTDDREAMRAYLEDHILRDKAVFDRDYRVRRLCDGEVRWVHGRGTLETDAAGHPIRMFGVIQDVTESHEANTALMRSTKLLEEAERLACMGSWEWDVSNELTHYSKGWQRIYGVDRSRFSDEASLELVHPDDREIVLRERANVLAGNGAFHARYRIIRRSDRALRHMEVFGEPVKSGHGDVDKVFGASLDVTSKVEAEQRLQDRERELEHLISGVVGALVSTVEMRDPYTSGHQNRVAQLAVAMAQRLGWSTKHIAGLEIAALLHDIGKVVVPSEILTKPSRLSEAEFMLIKDHAAAGGKILSSVQFDGPVQTAIVQHHERMDGSGYPDGVKGDEIIAEARLLAVADVYEAMISHRPYRPGLPVEMATEELRTGEGQTYDAEAVEACLHLTKNGFIFET